MSNTNTGSTRRAPRLSLLRRGVAAAALVAGGIVIGAGGLAVAGGEMGGGMMGSEMGWHHHHHHGFMAGMLQRRVRGALDNVGATTAQEDKVHDVIANATTELDKDKGERGAMRRQILDLMKAPTLDRDAFEKLRAQKVSEMDAKSKVVSNALFDAASQLSPEQRAKLVGDFEARMDHGGWGHHRDGEHDRDRGMERGMDRSPGDHGPDGHDGPDHG